MNYRVTVLPLAEQDIERNADWWATHHSVEQAIRWLCQVQVQLHSLEESPTRYPLSPENNDFSYDIRDKRVGIGSHPRFRAVFTIQDSEVFILSVRAAEQDALKPGDLRFEA